jgi:hypothetical protein
VLVLGAVGLARALTPAALFAPSQANAAARSYTPVDPNRVVASAPVARSPDRERSGAVASQQRCFV